MIIKSNRKHLPINIHYNHVDNLFPRKCFCFVLCSMLTFPFAFCNEWKNKKWRRNLKKGWLVNLNYIINNDGSVSWCGLRTVDFVLDGIADFAFSLLAIQYIITHVQDFVLACQKLTCGSKLKPMFIFYIEKKLDFYRIFVHFPCSLKHHLVISTRHTCTLSLCKSNIKKRSNLNSLSLNWQI
jgi:hypothetical protein